MRCDTCKFWLQLEDEHGECRRRSPRPDSVEVNTEAIYGRWPLTHELDWCGEYEIGPRSEESP